MNKDNVRYTVPKGDSFIVTQPLIMKNGDKWIGFKDETNVGGLGFTSIDNNKNDFESSTSLVNQIGWVDLTQVQATAKAEKIRVSYPLLTSPGGKTGNETCSISIQGQIVNEQKNQIIGWGKEQSDDNPQTVMAAFGYNEIGNTQ